MKIALKIKRYILHTLHMTTYFLNFPSKKTSLFRFTGTCYDYDLTKFSIFRVIPK